MTHLILSVGLPVDLDRSADDTAGWLLVPEFHLLVLWVVLLVLFSPAFLPSSEAIQRLSVPGLRGLIRQIS